MYLTIAVFALSSLPAWYFLAKQVQENRIVKEYLLANGLSKSALNRATAFKVARQVIADFNIDEKTFKKLILKDRPFLREDTGFLLTYREGLCGEGARVIVNLLNNLGFDATRISLYDKFLQSAHTLISVRLQNEEFWVNSINSPEDVTLYLEKNNVTTDNFSHLRYQENIELRKGKTPDHINGVDSGYYKSFGQYYIYSYEAIPVTKIFSKVGVDVRFFNLQRPPRFISLLAEKPFMILFSIYISLATVLTLTFYKLSLKLVKPARLQRPVQNAK